MFNLMPRDTVFYDLFEGMSRHAVKSAEYLRQLAKNFPNIETPLQRIREEEHAADQLAHQALDRLDRTFITPFDREDIHDLIGELDDIIDGVDALAKRFPLFHVERMDPTFERQTEVPYGWGLPGEDLTCWGTAPPRRGTACPRRPPTRAAGGVACGARSLRLPTRERSWPTSHPGTRCRRSPASPSRRSGSSARRRPTSPRRWRS